METNAVEEKPLPEQGIFECLEVQFSAKTNLMEMSREEFAMASRILLGIWQEIDERKPN